MGALRFVFGQVKWRTATAISLHQLEQYLEDVPQPYDRLGASNGPDCGEHSERDFLDDRHAELRPAQPTGWKAPLKRCRRRKRGGFIRAPARVARPSR